MSIPTTVSDALHELRVYHEARAERFQELRDQGGDARTNLLLEELQKLEKESIQIISEEQDDLGVRDQTRLFRGSAFTNAPPHSATCQCGSSPTFDETISCALAKNDQVDALIDRIDGATAANSIRELARRMRDLEQTKARQISSYLRED